MSGPTAPRQTYRICTAAASSSSSVGSGSPRRAVYFGSLAATRCTIVMCVPEVGILGPPVLGAAADARPCLRRRHLLSEGDRCQRAGNAVAVDARGLRA